MANLSIKSKLLVMLLAVSLFSIVAVASLNYYTCYQTLKSAVFSHLTSVRASRADQIEQGFERLRLETIAIAAGGATVDAARQFIDAYRKLDAVPIEPPMDAALHEFYQQIFVPEYEKQTGRTVEIDTLLPENPAARYLQYHYIVKNPFPIDEKGGMVRADDASDFSRVHAALHPAMRRLLQTFGFAGMYLIDIETGAIVYTEGKRTDFATRLSDGRYARTHLGDLFRRVQRAPDRSVALVEDFQRYLPIFDQPRAFVGVPVFDGGRAIAVLVLRLSPNQINRVMTANRQWERDGLGKTGETYLVGPDYLMRSDSRFLIEEPQAYAEQLANDGVPAPEIAAILRENSTILVQKVRSEAAEQALRGNEGTGVLTDYRGVEVLDSWAPLHIAGLEWGIVAKIDRDEAFAPMQHIARDTLIQTLVILLIITVVVMFLATSFVRPVNELIARVQLARTGKTDMTFAAESTDEIVDLARSFRELIDGVQKQTQMLNAATSENQLLLENVMPKRIAERVRVGGGTVAEHFEDVTIVFAELRGLAQFTQATSDDESVTALKRLITAFDEIALSHGVERIKTIGDTYLAVTGLSQPLLDHMRRSVEFARAARAIVADFAREKSAPLGLTVGIGSGPVIADVMGHGHAQFQLWGAAVIAADHAMDCGGVNDIVVSSSVRDGLADQFEFEPLAESAVPLWRLVDRG
ncbi:MAG TPA: adenylate/guanylate cyclase domain-containing protein [Pseudomonadales bacterium]